MTIFTNPLTISPRLICTFTRIFAKIANKAVTISTTGCREKRMDKGDKTIEVFCCYARNDLPLLIELKKHLSSLEREKLISLWADVNINAGAQWEEEIHRHLNTAQIILLLVSPDFIASEYCYSIEMQQAMRRHDRGEARVIPIILRPVYWQKTPFGKIQALPKDASPITSGKWHHQDEAFYSVTEGIRKTVEDILAKEAKQRRLVEKQLPHRSGQTFPATPSPQYLRESAPSSVTVKSTRRQTSKRILLAGLVGLIIVTLSSGIIWFTYFHNSTSQTSQAGLITEFSISTPKSDPTAITTGPDGNLWFTEDAAVEIGRMPPAGGDIVEFSIPTKYGYPQEITTGPDHNLWFTELNGKIGRITPTNGKITEFSIPKLFYMTNAITVGPDGNLWFTEDYGNQIGRISTRGIITEFAIQTPQSNPGDIVEGPDKNLWFTEYNANKIGRISPDGNIIEYSIPTPGSNPQGITVGSDGNLWFTESTSYKIGRISTSGNFYEYSIPSLQSDPSSITMGPDHNLWFTEMKGNKIGRISINGNITEFSLPTLASGPNGITVGPDKNLWFTESNSNKIGRITSGM